MNRTFEPIDALHMIVDYIWVVDFDFLADDNREDIIMPLGHINIIFNYGSAYRLVGEDQEVVIPNTVVIGQMKRAKHIRYGQQLYQIGISLTPLGFLQLFHVPSLVVKAPLIFFLCVGLVIMAYLVSMLVARRIKRISAYGLIIE